VVERTDLKEEDARSDRLPRLRLMRVWIWKIYRSRFGADLREQYDAELSRLREAGLIEIDHELLRLTTRGALLSNEVFAALA